MLAAIALSFAVIFVAELGDKSQLMALTFATRFRPVPVLVGITLATAATHALSVALGAVLGVALPTRWITLAAGVAFLAFAVWTLRGDALSDDEEDAAGRTTRSAVVAVAVAFFLAELGDKTMFATIALATREGVVGTFVGSTAGMVAADALAILVGHQLAARFSQRTVKVGAAVLFAVFGVLLLVEAARG